MQSRVATLEWSDKVSETKKDGVVMTNLKTKKCAHIPCLCNVPIGEEFCGESCRDAGSEDVEIACQCDHPACPLTFRGFVGEDAAGWAN
jgi:hypothetical protein